MKAYKKAAISAAKGFHIGSLSKLFRLVDSEGFYLIDSEGNYLKVKN